MYKVQKKVAPQRATYLGVYSIRSCLPKTIRPIVSVEHNSFVPAQTDSCGSEEDPFPNSTRLYSKRLSGGPALEVVATQENRLYSGFSTIVSQKKSTIINEANELLGRQEQTRHRGIALVFQHIGALTKRYLLIKIRDITRVANLTYFPVADIILAGFISFWMQRNSPNTQLDTMIYLLELTFWLVINGTHIEACFNFIEELQTRNFINIFASSLKHLTWIAASSVLSMIEALLTATVCGFFLYFVYDINFFVLGWFFPIFLLLSFFSGWIMGIITISLLLSRGLHLTIMTLALPYIVMSLCAAYYPLATLPWLIQVVAHCIPTTYMFEALRALLMDHVVRYDYFMISFALHIAFLIGALIFYNYMFKRSMDRGLMRIENE